MTWRRLPPIKRDLESNGLECDTHFCGSGLTREAGAAVDGTGRAGVRG